MAYIPIDSSKFPFEINARSPIRHTPAVRTSYAIYYAVLTHTKAWTPQGTSKLFSGEHFCARLRGGEGNAFDEAQAKLQTSSRGIELDEPPISSTIPIEGRLNTKIETQYSRYIEAIMKKIIGSIVLVAFALCLAGCAGDDAQADHRPVYLLSQHTIPQ